MRDAATLRRQRLTMIRGWLLSKGRLPMNRIQLEALLELKHGLKRRTLREYLKTMEDAGIIDINEDTIEIGDAYKIIEETQ